MRVKSGAPVGPDGRRAHVGNNWEEGPPPDEGAPFEGRCGSTEGGRLYVGAEESRSEAVAKFRRSVKRPPSRRLGGHSGERMKSLGASGEKLTSSLRNLWAGMRGFKGSAGTGAKNRAADETAGTPGRARSPRPARPSGEAASARPSDGTVSRVPVRRKRSRLRFTRRFYVLLGILAGIILVIVLAAVLSGGGSQGVLRAGVGLKDSDLNRLKVNELGAVMILEYHRIAEEGRWSRTPDNFRADLEYLYEQGYRCISLKDLVTNNIRVEAGYTPVVFTFDDSDPSQFRYIEENGQLIIDPKCAVGIMEQFSKEHPDFNMTATFYVLPTLFGQEEYAEKKLRYLAEHGYDIGNHTVNHVSLGEVDQARALEELAGNIRLVQKYLPGYEQASIALPNGSEPKDYSLFTYGDYDGIRINFLASLLVGANPAPAPCDRNFDPMRLPRIQALDPSLDTGDSGLYAWIQYFADNPERLYVSDGDPDTVTIPRHMADRVNMDRLGDKRLRTY